MYNYRNINSSVCLQVCAGLLLYLFSLASCTSQTTDKNPANPATATAVPKKEDIKPGSSFTDTLTIMPGSALFFNPDSAQLNMIRGTFDKNRFESLEHDCYFQMRNARNVIRQYWPGIRMIESNKHRYLRFVDKKGKATIIDLNTSDICGIYLYNGIKQPVLTDMMNIDTELEQYFRQ